MMACDMLRKFYSKHSLSASLDSAWNAGDFKKKYIINHRNFLLGGCI